MQLILASASPARLSTLRRAGLHPQVIVSGVNEDAISGDTVAEVALALARAKCAAVASRIVPRQPTLVVGCDSLLEFAGQAQGKPADAAEALRRWQAMRGRSGVLHTGHSVTRLDPGQPPTHVSAVASTTVRFAEVSDDELDAYIDTGEPLAVAGAFTIDGLGGAFVAGVEGDPHNVVGISLPLLRRLVAELGVGWTSLWRPAQPI